MVKNLNKTVKYYISVKAEFCKVVDPSIVTDPPVVLNSETFTNLEGADLVFYSKIQYK